MAATYYSQNNAAFEVVVRNRKKTVANWHDTIINQNVLFAEQTSSNRRPTEPNANILAPSVISLLLPPRPHLRTQRQLVLYSQFIRGHERKQREPQQAHAQDYRSQAKGPTLPSEGNVAAVGRPIHDAQPTGTRGLHRMRADRRSRFAGWAEHECNRALAGLLRNDSLTWHGPLHAGLPRQ